MDFSYAVSLTLLAAALLGGLLLVPLGLPGLWIMLGAGLLYWILVPTGGIGLLTFVGAAIVVVLAEFLEFTIAGNYTRKYGGSRRAAWGAIIGGVAGAIVGVPIPVLGSLVGAFIGTFAGAFMGEWMSQSRSRAARSAGVDQASGVQDARGAAGTPTRAATGALLGRAVAAAVKSGLGVLVAIWLFLAAALGGAG